MSEQQSSIVSGFQFLNYKVDSFNVKNKNRVSNILTTLKADDKWTSSISIRKPTLYKKDLLCLGGVRLLLVLPDETIEEKKRTTENALISLDCNIVGLFKVIDPKEYESKKEEYENLMKYQIPAILSPFLRSTITSYFANAGHGSFIFPLINFYQLAFEQKVELEIIEDKQSNI